MQTPRGYLRDQVAEPTSIDPTGKVVQFLNAHPYSATHEGGAALDLVYQAAEMIKGIEDRAAALEVRAKDLVTEAAERMQLAERRILTVEAERHAAEARMNQAAVRVREVEQALERAGSRIAAAEDLLSTAEMRAQTAETRASQAEQTLARIEDAIRTRLLGQRRGVRQSDRGLSVRNARYGHCTCTPAALTIRPYLS